jgi:hypothetical protein
MEKINKVLVNIQSSIQYVVDAVIGLLFQPLYTIVAIIQALIEIWLVDEADEEEEQPQQNVTVYPSANEGKYAEECDLPACNEEHRIGFRINQTEQDEINKIKRQLKNGK